MVLARGWEVIPVENLLAQSDSVLAEAATLDEARLAAGIWNAVWRALLYPEKRWPTSKPMLPSARWPKGAKELLPAVITRVESVGLGHRVCADTLSILRKGQGMLVGNSSAFTFLVHENRTQRICGRPPL